MHRPLTRKEKEEAYRLYATHHKVTIKSVRSSAKLCCEAILFWLDNK